MAKNIGRKDVLSLYKSFLKTAKKWPMEPNREARSMRPFMISNIKQTFRKFKDTKDKQFIQKLYANGVDELNSLREIHDGVNEKQVSRIY
jgi:hypothetical protein